MKERQVAAAQVVAVGCRSGEKVQEGGFSAGGAGVDHAA